MHEKLARADVLILAHGAKGSEAWDANYTTFAELADAFIEIGKDRLVPPEIWAVGSEAEFHGDLGMPELVDYAASKRAFARRALSYYRSPDVLYRHIVPSAFTSAMGKGAMSADTAAAVALFFIRRGFSYVPVTSTTLALWNYFRFIRQQPEPATAPARLPLTRAPGDSSSSRNAHITGWRRHLKQSWSSALPSRQSARWATFSPSWRWR